MTVKELIEQLQEANPDDIVILQKDAEGNGYSPLSGVDPRDSAYIPETTWAGEVRYRQLTLELKELGYDEEDTVAGFDNVQNCVVLWPVN